MHVLSCASQLKIGVKRDIQGPANLLKEDTARRKRREKKLDKISKKEGSINDLGIDLVIGVKHSCIRQY